MKWWKLLCNGR